MYLESESEFSSRNFEFWILFCKKSSII